MAGLSDGQELRLLKPSASSGSQRQRLTDGVSDEGSDSCSDLSSQQDGINVVQTTLLISGSTCGFGSLSVIVLVVSTGWIGLVLSGVIYATVVFTSVLLVRCWNMVREKWQSERHPYGAIGYEAFGSRASRAIHVILVGCCFNASISCFLVASEMIIVIGGPALRGTFCYWPLAIGIAVCPLMWLGTPKDFWWLSVMSFFADVLVMLLVFIGLILNGNSHLGVTDIDIPLDVPQESVFLHLAQLAGSVVLLSSLHFSLPTIQQDMKRPSSAGRAIVIGYTLNVLLVLPLLVTLYIVYGSTLVVTGNESAFTFLPDDAIKTVSGTLLMVHIAQVILITNNPLHQFLEETLNIPADFTWKRVLLRSSLLLAQVFIQESVPHFSLFFAITGGCLLPTLVFIIPSLCYLRLRSLQLQKCGTSETPKAFLLEKVFCWAVIGVTPFFMASVFYVTVSEMIAGRTVFTVPCYVNATQARPD